MSSKLVAALVVGALSPLANAELPPPWGLILGAVIAAAAYVADHDGIVAKLKGEPRVG